MRTILGLLAFSTANSQYTPSYGPGALIAWWICHSNRRSPIGGWLLYYFWQLYGGIAITAAFLFVNIESYVPENFANTRMYLLFLASVVPVIIASFAQMIAATFLLIVRSPEMLRLVKILIAVEFGTSVVGLAIEAMYYPDNLFLSAIGTVNCLLWLAYFYRSSRVQYVFCSRDWDSAVKLIYPEKARAATS